MIGIGLMAIGGIVSLVGWIMLVVAGFRKSVLWGILNLISVFILIPMIIFIIMHWSEAKKGFLVWLLGVILYFVGIFLGGGAAMMQMQPPAT